jgi:hypothetical protein
MVFGLHDNDVNDDDDISHLNELQKLFDMCIYENIQTPA